MKRPLLTFFFIMMLAFARSSYAQLMRPADLTALPVDPPDGLVWGEITTETIRKDVAYGGIRATLPVDLAGARLSIQIDVGFGDAITPGAVEKEWRELLHFPSARLLVYPPESVIAEKLQAAVSLGINNSRMKDFYDLHWLLTNLNFNGKILTEAVRNTFTRRATAMPKEAPIAFTNEFSANEQKIVQWNAFLRKGRLPSLKLDEVIKAISHFLLPIIKQQVSNCVWSPSNHWQEDSESS